MDSKNSNPQTGDPATPGLTQPGVLLPRRINSDAIHVDISEALRFSRVLLDLCELCLKSYKWDEETFGADVALRRGRDGVLFRRKPGKLLWGDIIRLPVNCAGIFAYFVYEAGGLVLFTVTPIAFAASWYFSTIAIYQGLWMVFYWFMKFGLLAGVLVGLIGFGILVRHPELASARAFCFVDEHGKPTVVFRGSDLVDNLTINAFVLFCKGPRRHLGFHRAWWRISEDVTNWLSRVAADGGEIVLTGHSLGGALAQIAAFELAPKFTVSSVVSFGSSRIGGKDMFEQYLNRRDADENRITAQTHHLAHEEDLIPRLPPAYWFCHVGNDLLLSESGCLGRNTKSDSILGSVIGWKVPAAKYPPAHGLAEPKKSELAEAISALWQFAHGVLRAFHIHLDFAPNLRKVFKRVSQDHGLKLYRTALTRRVDALTYFSRNGERVFLRTNLEDEIAGYASFIDRGFVMI